MDFIAYAAKSRATPQGAINQHFLYTDREASPFRALVSKLLGFVEYLSMNHKLCSVDQAVDWIESGRCLMIAGARDLLSALPHGNWIGGTIPYFIAEEGGTCDTEQVFVTELQETRGETIFTRYDETNIAQIVADGPINSLTLVIMPAFSDVHEACAKGAPNFPGMYMRPIIGWVSGVAINDIGKIAPEVFFGPTGQHGNCFAVAAHLPISFDKHAHVDIVNVFEPGDGPIIRFEKTDFQATQCEIDGRRANLAAFILANNVDTRLPLVAEQHGTLVNTSIASVEPLSGVVKFYAPVFPGVNYTFASELGNYASQFEKKVPEDSHPLFACNCILNYLYGELEGKKLSIQGPVTFGEIAYLLMNQTMVYVEIGEAA